MAEAPKQFVIQHGILYYEVTRFGGDQWSPRQFAKRFTTREAAERIMQHYVWRGFTGLAVVALDDRAEK
jgi:hypothetical protein